MSSVKVQFEIGHEASRKTKISKDGFTHDWELFVRGADSSDISIFVDKVVFNIHESFPKPKRVFKEPPYSLKEAGYAGFVLTIDIYFKNRDDPKKVTFNYDLDLAPIKSQKEEYVFINPTDEFRRKCLKGGGVIVTNISSDQKSREAFSKTSSSAINLSNDSKKHKQRPEDAKNISSLFGSTKKPSSKVSPDPRAINSSPNPVKVQGGKGTGGEKPSISSSKEKDKDKGKHKHSGNKDSKESKKEERSASKSEESKSKKEKKDRDRSKEKSAKRPTSPKRSPKRPPSPASNLGAATISRNSASFNTSTGGKDKPQLKHQPIAPDADKSNSTNKKSNKKDKKNYERDRERLDKKAQKESKKEISSADKKALFESTANKPSNVKERDSSTSKDDKEKVKGKVVPPEPKNAVDQSTMKKGDKHSDRKHKKEKKVKESSKDKKREKSEKSSSKNSSGASRSMDSSAIISPVKVKEPKHEVPTKVGVMNRLSDKDSSDSEADSPLSLKNDSDNSNSIPEPPKLIGKSEKGIKRSRDKGKPSAGDKEEKKRKRKVKDASSSPLPKQMKKDNSPARERPSSSASISQPLANSLTNNNHIEANSTSQQPPMKISNDYMNELKELKNKITTLKNNDDLQYVVQLIASTGCYEITKSTFDFDLCLLDQKTVEKLQEFLNTNT